MSITEEEKQKTIQTFKQVFEMYSTTPEPTLEMYFDLSEDQAIPNTKPTIKYYSIALWMAYLFSLNEYNINSAQSNLTQNTIGISSKTMADRSESYSQGNNLTQVQKDPRGFLAQYEALYNQYTGNEKGMFFMSAGKGHL